MRSKVFRIAVLLGLLTACRASRADPLDDSFVYLPLVTMTSGAPTVAGCAVLPADNIWNTPVDTLPVDANSDSYIATIGADCTMHADFGSGLWNGGPIGIPYTDVLGTQPLVDVSFYYDEESDAGPYPIPSDAPIEGGPDADGDRHVLVVDRDNCTLYELYDAWPQPDGSWEAGSGAIFDLNSHALRTDGWTSADAAGLPILPGLVRYDEVASGEIRHAIRFTAPQTRDDHVWPACHDASSLTSIQYPPMGQRFRLKATFDISGFSPDTQVILQALQTYGMILADNGSAWYISGAPDEGWDNDVLHELHDVPGSAFQAVDVSSLMIDADSGQAWFDFHASWYVPWVGEDGAICVGGGVDHNHQINDATQCTIWRTRVSTPSTPISVRCRSCGGAWPTAGRSIGGNIRSGSPTAWPKTAH